MANVQLHIKILEEPSSFSIQDIIEITKNIYSQYNISIEVLSTENLNLPLLFDVDVGRCTKDGISNEQMQLFANRNNATNDQIVVYYARSTDPPFNGCSSFPDGKPSTIISKHAGKWTLPHELGHILGLGHSLHVEQLMFGLGTDNITANPPILTESELATIKTSKFIHQ